MMSEAPSISVSPSSRMSCAASVISGSSSGSILKKCSKGSNLRAAVCTRIHCAMQLYVKPYLEKGTFSRCPHFFGTNIDVVV